MKRFGLFNLAFFGLAGCLSTVNHDSQSGLPELTKENIQGIWLCHTRYPKFHLYATDLMQLHADGTMLDSSMMSFPVDNPKLAAYFYKMVDRGTWSLKGKQLVYNFMSRGKVTREVNKNEDIWEAIQTDKNLSRYLKTMDKRNYEIFTSNTFSQQVVLSIENYDKNNLQYVQKMGKDIYFGKCIAMMEVPYDE